MTYPIVLAHGVCRFDFLWNESLDIDNNDDPDLDKLHYFKGLRTMLMSKGFSVHHSKVSWGASVDKRAADLKDNVLKILETTRAGKVNLIAHSMGGLDARHMLFNDRNRGKIHERVASLTTVATPHRGTPFADWGLKNLNLLAGIIQKIGLDIAGLKDLQTDVCQAYNALPEVRAFETNCADTIMFQTFAGKQNFLGVLGPLKISCGIIEQKEGANDGLVSVQSAKWKDAYFVKTLAKTDHLNSVGWWDVDQLLVGEGPDNLLKRIHAFYTEIVETLP